MGRSVLCVLICTAAAFFPLRAPGAPGDVISRHAFDGLAPQDIAWDGSIFYVTSFLEDKISRFTADLETALLPLDSPFQSWLGLSGIAYDSNDNTLWVVEPMSREMAEIDLQGNLTGRRFTPEFLPVVGPMAQPIPRGMDFDPSGDSGRGTIYVVESVGSLIYEISLDGVILRWFSHPDDPDGFPGTGLTASGPDVDLVHDAQGALQAILAIGGRSRPNMVRRLDRDGNYNGFSIPLTRVGGTISGILYQPFQEPGGQMVDPALIAVIDSKAEIAVVDGHETPIPEILDFACSVSQGAVDLSWRSGLAYDRIEFFRDCDLLATLPGDAGAARDESPRPGHRRYWIQAFLGAHSTRSDECSAMLGTGQVLRSEDYDGTDPVDLAVDEQGYIYISDYFDRNVHIHEPNLKHWATVEFPFLTETDRITGVAWNPEGNGGLFIYNSETNVIFETDLGGMPRAWILVDLPNDPDNPRDQAVVGGMAYDPQGGENRDGLFWIIEMVRETVYSIGRDGKIRSSFPHPVSVQCPLPPLSGIYNFTGGLSEFPYSDFGLLDLTSGSYFEGDLLRIIRVNSADGKEPQPGFEIPLDGLDILAPSEYVAIQYGRRADGKPVLFAVAEAGRNPKLVELDISTPSPRPITNLAGRIGDRMDEAILTFRANDTYDRIEVVRDCQPLAEIPGAGLSPGPAEHRDAGAPPGLHRYDLEAVKGADRTSLRSVLVRTGPGALLQRAFAYPAASPYQLARDPIDGSFLVSSNSPALARSLFRYRQDFTFDRELKNLMPEGWEIATMAVRSEKDGPGKIHAIAWKKITQIGDKQTFPMYIFERDGTPVPGTIEIHPPVPSNGFTIYPTGLCYSSREGVFYYLEKNSKTLVRMDERGNTLGLFPHPEPPLQSYVSNFGMAFDDENGTLLLTTCGPEELLVTKVIQLTSNGRRTGIEIPLDYEIIGRVTGISAAGPWLIAEGFFGVSEIFRLHAFEPIPPPRDLVCAESAGGVLLSWQPGAAYDQVVVLRDGAEIQVISGSVTTFLDGSAAEDRYLVYSVLGRIDGRTGKNAVCEKPPRQKGFIRGDVDGSGDLSITDAIRTLDFLFLGGPEPTCKDAVDADDTGALDLTDAIRILGFLFLGEAQPPPPFPQQGLDPTPDPFECR